MTKYTNNSPRNPDLSIVILSFNTKEVLKNCLQSIKVHKTKLHLQVIVVDNNSQDGSDKMVKEKFKNFELIKNTQNLGFAKGNNSAKETVKANTVLFLNSDTLLHKDCLDIPFKYLKENKDVGAVTCKVVLPNGKLDKDTRRAFPTPWVAFTHFSGLPSKYWYEYISEDKTHEVDVIQGAYFMVKKDVLDKVGWFDEDYFLDGEDIDLCWKIWRTGKKIVYLPTTKITHIKKASKSKDRKKSLKSVTRGVEAMALFYKKRLWDRYPIFINYLVILGIKALKFLRTIKYYLSV